MFLFLLDCFGGYQDVVRESCTLIGIATATTVRNDAIFLVHDVLLSSRLGAHKKTRRSRARRAALPGSFCLRNPVTDSPAGLLALGSSGTLQPSLRSGPRKWPGCYPLSRPPSPITAAGPPRTFTVFRDAGKRRIFFNRALLNRATGGLSRTFAGFQPRRHTKIHEKIFAGLRTLGGEKWCFIFERLPGQGSVSAAQRGW
jgi:hypothetical protein